MECTICQNFEPPTLDTLTLGQTALIWVDAAALARSAESRACHECQLLSSAIKLWQPKWMNEAEKWGALRLEMAVDKPIQLKYLPYGTEHGNDIQIFRHPSNSVTNSCLPRAIGTAPIIPETSGSSESINQIKSWLHQCMTTHELCKTVLPGTLPKRLLDVGAENPTLIQTVGTAGTPYVALSYCWGDPDHHPIVKTLKSNYNKHEAGVSFKSLPPALKDAIHLTKELGFRYIWIDALCIIQDDDQDWLEESANMCRVYLQATLTIIASRSDGTGSGIFGDQRYNHYKLVPYKNTQVAVRLNIARDHETNPVVPLDNPHPISLRAWTFQEAVLSNRAIHVTPDELRWECNTWQLCQCEQVAKKLPLIYDPDYYEYENYRMWRLDDFFPATSLQDAYEMWALLWGFYTIRRLTREQDRLVALSGMANRFHAVLRTKFSINDTYLAGLWKGAIPEQLLWYVESREDSVLLGNKHKRPDVWRAPSWSWASMEAPVHINRNRGLQSRLQVLEASTESLGPDPFGGLKSARLTVRGPVLHDVKFVHDPNGVHLGRYLALRYQSCDLRIARIYVDDDHDTQTDKYLRHYNQNFNVLVIGFTKSADMHECMVIVPVPGRPDHFERIALIRLGQHLREPKEHALVIESAPVENIVLL